MDDKQFWDAAFITVAGWAFHPGYLKNETEKLTIAECAEIATAMLEERSEKWDGVG